MYVLFKTETGWSTSKKAFFSTDYNEHGTAFSPDGSTIYFASTRPLNNPEIAQTWHIWRSYKTGNSWSKPEFVDIPNMNDKLVSHPSVASDGTLYFHAGNIDYSDLAIYSAKPNGALFFNAVRLENTINRTSMECTPFIAPDKSYLIYESVPDLYISYNKGNRWQTPIKLNSKINREGRGNPYVSPDGNYLFYVSGTKENPQKEWSVYWINMEHIF